MLPLERIIVLLVSDEGLPAASERALHEAGLTVVCARSGDEAVAAAASLGSPGVAAVDIRAASADGAGLQALRAAAGERVPLILLSNRVEHHWQPWLAQGLVQDVVPLGLCAGHLQLRFARVLLEFARARELRMLREAVASQGQPDPLTGVYGRAGVLSLLFRETDRVQRMGTSLAVILCDVGLCAAKGRTIPREIFRQVVPRFHRLLRTYDFLGEVKPGLLLIALPGCNEENAVRLAERARAELAAAAGADPAAACQARTCFGIAESGGRSPLIVLREAERALALAHAAGPGSIRAVAYAGRTEARPPACAEAADANRDDALPPTQRVG